MFHREKKRWDQIANAMTNQIWTYINILERLSSLLVRFLNENILSLKDLCLPIALKIGHNRSQSFSVREVCHKFLHVLISGTHPWSGN